MFNYKYNDNNNDNNNDINNDDNHEKELIITTTSTDNIENTSNYNNVMIIMIIIIMIMYINSVLTLYGFGCLVCFGIYLNAIRQDKSLIIIILPFGQESLRRHGRRISQGKYYTMVYYSIL